MGGYRQDNFDLDAGEPVDELPKSWRWKLWLGAFAYMIVIFWLWSITGFPDSFGVHETCRGKGCVLDDYYYSYLFVQRHRPLDIAAFVLMWAPIIGYPAWLALNWRKADAQELTPPANLNTPSVFDAEEAADRRRRILSAVVISLALGGLLIAIWYFKGA